MTRCSHCEEERHSRCSYADCPFDVDQSAEIIAGLRTALAVKEAECEALRVERDEKQAALQKIADEHLPYVEGLEAEIKRIRAETIEECANVADGYRHRTPDRSLRIGAGWIADDIRAALATKDSGNGS